MRPKDLSFLDAVSEIDWARLSAYIDGEGCIRIKSNKGASGTSRRIFYAEVLVSNTDFRLLQWIQSRFGGSVHVCRKAKDHYPACGNWCVGARHAATIVRRCLEYFVIKRDQADVVMAFQATVLPDRRYGMKGRPQELVDKQADLAQRLSEMKGLSSLRGKKARAAPLDTIQ